MNLNIHNQYKPVLMYVFFGICTTLINIVIYAVFYKILNIENITSTVIAWIFANIFAFFTNKIWVFNSNDFDKKTIIYELIKFFLCRLGTGVIDVVIMWITVNYLNLNALFWKCISNIIVIILNYVASKHIIFLRENK